MLEQIPQKTLVQKGFINSGGADEGNCPNYLRLDLPSGAHVLAKRFRGFYYDICYAQDRFGRTYSEETPSEWSKVASRSLDSFISLLEKAN